MDKHRPVLYFDHGASTPPHPDVIRTLAEVMERHYANPSSIHGAGLEAGRLLRRAQELAAQLLGTSAEEWVFTSGGTESNQLAVIGGARAARARGRHIVVSEIEHPSVKQAAERLEAEGFEVTRLAVDGSGRIRLDHLEAAIRPDTTLVSIMHVNNEVGSVQPIEEAGAVVRRFPGVLFHVDGVQSVGKLPIRLNEWGIDLFSVSAHKLRGPKGTGLLYARAGVKIEPLIGGSGQDGDWRGGTPNVPAIVASAKALRLAVEGQTERAQRMRGLRKRLLERLSAIPELQLSGDADPDSPRQAPHVLHLSYPGMKPEVIVHALEEEGIIVSTKSACSSKDEKPSDVLLAMGYPVARAAGGIRITFGDEHDEEAADRLADSLEAVVKRLKPLERSKS
ncbi:cysteine desulfurase [Paenibacillus albicereus]|uniref:Cysteine desulfurase n=1 Tax=Paenibacillus albicereus TaxID=2726185 RepID=A0A6H2GYL8_9BACL|nr:cysteine desulfurase family protein [Paenibacillus albicereus]QJC52533.1 cysteine desulfurase [Paenibacillus albicereus]